MVWSLTVLVLYCIAADSSHIWRWQSGGDFVTHGFHPTWGYLAQQNNLWALESRKSDTSEVYTRGGLCTNPLGNDKY